MVDGWTKQKLGKQKSHTKEKREMAEKHGAEK
jgi:hypothetical protein